MGFGVTTQGRADDVVDGVILIYLQHELHTPVERPNSGLRELQQLSMGEQLCQAPEVAAF